MVVLGAYYWLIWQETQAIGENYGFEEKLAQINSQAKEAEQYIYDNRIKD